MFVLFQISSFLKEYLLIRFLTGVTERVSLVGQELVFVLEYHQWDKSWCSSWSITSGTRTSVRLGVSLVGQELVFVLEYHQWDKNWCSSWSITSGTRTSVRLGVSLVGQELVSTSVFVSFVMYCASLFVSLSFSSWPLYYLSLFMTHSVSIQVKLVVPIPVTATKKKGRSRDVVSSYLDCFCLLLRYLQTFPALS